MFKKIGVLLVTVLGGALLVYSATRSLDFIELTLPEDRKILAYFGLAALDGGLIAWLLSYLYGSRGGWQRAISILMVGVDAVGAIAMFTLDTLYNTGKAGLTEAMTPEELTNAVLALSAIIALNIVATIAHHLTDPEKMREQAEEEAFSKVEEAALKQISRNADALAAKLAPTMAADWMNQTEARYLSYVGTGKMPTIDATAQNVPLPVMLPDNQQPAFNLWQFLPAWMTNKFSGRKFESAVTSPHDNLDVKPKAQAAPTTTGNKEPTESLTQKPREGLHFPMWEKPVKAFLLAAWLAASKASHARFNFAGGRFANDNFRIPVTSQSHARSADTVCVPGRGDRRRDRVFGSRVVGMVEVNRTCARCGEPYDGALHGRYCSNSCKQKAYRSRKQYGNAQTSKELRTCARCGVQFEGALHGRYHSAACKQAAYRERKARKAVTV